jgi:hypothetical protein
VITLTGRNGVGLGHYHLADRLEDEVTVLFLDVLCVDAGLSVAALPDVELEADVVVAVGLSLLILAAGQLSGLSETEPGGGSNREPGPWSSAAASGDPATSGICTDGAVHALTMTAATMSIGIPLSTLASLSECNVPLPSEIARAYCNTTRLKWLLTFPLVKQRDLTVTA